MMRYHPIGKPTILTKFLFQPCRKSVSEEYFVYEKVYNNMKYKFSFLFHSLFSFSLFRSTHLLRNFSYKFCMIFNMYCCGNKFLRFTVQPSIQVLYHFLTQLDTVIYAQISKLYPDPKTTIFQHRYDGHTSKLLMQQRQHFITF